MLIHLSAEFGYFLLIAQDGNPVAATHDLLKLG
jgi:hypothetical protein